MLSATLAIAGLTVSAEAQAPNLSMSFSAPTISAGDTTRLSFRIKNNGSRTNSLVAFGNSLPAGLVIATQPGILNSCGGVVSASPGSSVFRISDVIVDPRSSCTVSFNVTATSAGVKNIRTTQVTAAAGRGNGASAAITVFAPSTTVNSISPASGTTFGGTRVTITGTNLTGATAVTIGGVAVTNFTIVNPSTITAVTPAHDAGTVDVVVWTPRGTLTGTALYTYDSIVPAVAIGGAIAAGLAVGAAALVGGGTEAPLYPNVPVVPTVASVNPPSGTVMGGTSVTIKGTNLTGATTVRIGGALASSFSIVNATTINAMTSARVAGVADVAVTTPVGTGTGTALYTYVVPPPTVGTLSPTSGSTLGGTSVTITGTDLIGTTAVTFGGVAATSFVIVNATTITAITPAHAAGSVDVAVTTPGGTGTGTGIYTFVTPPPTVGSLSPTSGTTLGGTTVTITGTNLTGTMAVTFGGVAATSFVIVNATTITAVTPAHTAGTVDVVVTTPGGAGTGTGIYTFVTPPPTVGSLSPTSGTTLGGTIVTITGTNLTGTTAVTFGGVAATSFTIVNATTVTAVTPAHAAGAVDVAITTPGGTATSPFTYVMPAPTVTSIGPSSGSTLGGTTVTITGANLSGATAVMFGGVPATSFTIVNATTITAVSPPRSAGPVDVVVSTPGGTWMGTALYTFVLQSTTTSASSSANPSTFGQLVTLMATVSGTGGTPAGTVTFRDGATTLGTGTLNGAGQATFSTAALSVGSHSITAVYGGNATFTVSTSAALIQVVGIPADSARLQALQAGVTKLVAQSSGQTMSGAVDSAIAEGFNDGGELITPSDNGMRFSFPAETDRRSTVDERVGGSFAALGDPGRNVLKAPPPPPRIPREWLAWAEVRGTGWNTSVQAGDIRGGQVNALAGLTHKVTPDFLVGIFGGYETFNYSSQSLNGTLKGDGWTVGGYLGWRLFPGLRFDASVARSGIAYDGVAGAASGSFPGQRWYASGGLTGTYKAMYGLEIEPSARVYALWENESAYVDSLGIQHPDRNFSTGRASTGVKVAYPWMWSPSATLTPYAGVYADYYFNSDDAVALGAPNLLPTEYVQGFSARVVSGLAIAITGGPRLSFGGEFGGIGNDFKVWTVRGRAAVPF